MRTKEFRIAKRKKKIKERQKLVVQIARHGNVALPQNKGFVYPTNVGMIQQFRLLKHPRSCVSHKRGNDSLRACGSLDTAPYIPQTWE